MSDEEAFLECRRFVHAITLGGDVSKIQVHARLGLLGEFQPEHASKLYTPNQRNRRLQILADRQARFATIQNRDIPPLRPGVVEQIAQEFPNIQVITNGGIGSMESVRERINETDHIVGAMVGRAVINHPCAFGEADSLWVGNVPLKKPTRQEVLLDYIDYCQREEELFQMTVVGGTGALDALKRKLVAVPFHLFAGETGNNEYQRLIRKLLNKQKQLTCAGILTAALSQVPSETSAKPVNVFTTDLHVFEDAHQRSGPFQRIIH